MNKELLISMLLVLMFIVSCTSKISKSEVAKPEITILSPFNEAVFLIDDEIILSFETKNFNGYSKLTIDDGITERINEQKKVLNELSVGVHNFLIELFDVQGNSLNVSKKVSVLINEKPKENFEILTPKEGSEVENENVQLEFYLENLKGDAFKIQVDNQQVFEVKSKKQVIPELSLGKHSITAELFNEGKSTGLKKKVNFKIVEKKLLSETISRFEIKFPKEGYKAKGDLIAISLGLQNFSLGKIGGENKAEEGHFHIFVDGKEKPLEVDKATYTLKNLAKGKHSIIVEMVQNNHETLGLKKKLNFEAQIVTSEKD